MVASVSDLAVFTRADYDNLPDGRWEVVNGKAELMAPAKNWHQELSDEIVAQLRPQIKPAGRGYVISAAGVLIPVPKGVRAELQIRVPDIVIATHRTNDEYAAGKPPEWVIEILSVRRGNIERTGKMDDYARAGIREYWLVNAIDREVEVYSLTGKGYVLVEVSSNPRSITFPGVTLDMAGLWPTGLI